MTKHLGLAVLRILKGALDDGRLDREWLARFAEAEAARLAVGHAESLSPSWHKASFGRLLEHWFDGEGWTTDLEALEYEFRAGKAAIAVLRRLTTGDELGDQVASLIAEGAERSMSLLDWLTLLARFSTSEAQRLHCIENFLDTISVLGLEHEDETGKPGESPDVS